MQGAKRSSCVDLSKVCNAAADDSKGNPSKAYLFIEWDDSKVAQGVVSPPLVDVKYTSVVAPSPEPQ